MEETLTKLGFNAKEIRFYLLLLEHGKLTALQLSELTGEKRTNSYMILESLIDKDVVIAGMKTTVREFWLADPRSLTRLMEREQQRHKEARAGLQAVMPLLKSRYALATNRPGVVHMAGLEGFRTMLDDMSRSNTEVLLIASDLPADPEARSMLLAAIKDRKRHGITTRALYHQTGDDHDAQAEVELFRNRGMELRLLGKQQFPSEIAVYEDNVIFTAYQPTLVNTIVTNKDISQTMRLLFEELWNQAR